MEEATAVPAPSTFSPSNIEDEMKRSYLDYSLSVIIGPCAP